MIDPPGELLYMKDLLPEGNYLVYSLFGRHISCSLFMPIPFEIVNKCIFIQNTNVHKVLGDSHKYFTFISQICSFPSMLPLVFLVWQS